MCFYFWGTWPDAVYWCPTASLPQLHCSRDTLYCNQWNKVSERWKIRSKEASRPLSLYPFPLSFTPHPHPCPSLFVPALNIVNMETVQYICGTAYIIYGGQTAKPQRHLMLFHLVSFKVLSCHWNLCQPLESYCEKLWNLAHSSGMVLWFFSPSFTSVPWALEHHGSNLEVCTCNFWTAFPIFKIRSCWFLG